MRSAAASGRLNTHAIFAMDDRRLGGAQTKLNRAGLAGGAEIESAIVAHGERPVIDPGQPCSVVEPRLAKGAPARLLGEVKLLLLDVGDREVRELQVVDEKAGGFRISRGDR